MIDIQHNPDAKQFFSIVSGLTVTLRYKTIDENTVNFYSTFVPPELRGRQLGQELVKYGLEYAQENQLKVIPSCPFVKKYVEEHPEYKELIHPQSR